MPQASGPQLAHDLGRLRHDVGVVYMSGYPDEALGRHGVLEPETVLLSKPFTPAQLVSTIRRVLDERDARLGGR